MWLWKALGFGVCFASLVGPGRPVQTRPVYKGKQEKLPSAVAPQPVAFSHRKHAFMSCVDCHEGAASKEEAGFPDAEKCMLCHATIKADSSEVRKLAGFIQRREKIKWVRVYQVPDFVFFSHASHSKGGINCTACHGPVRQRDILEKEVSTSMVACMNCHAAKKVSTACYFCHQLGF
jgi:hypothetical protein